MNTELIVGIIVAVFGSNLAVEIFKASREDKKAKDQTLTKQDLKPILDKIGLLTEGVKNLEAIRLKILLQEWKHSDIRTADDWAEIEDLYRNYKSLNGNGRIEKLYRECIQIDTTE